jgi:hypothetical protein
MWDCQKIVKRDPMVERLCLEVKITLKKLFSVFVVLMPFIVFKRLSGQVYEYLINREEK